MSEREGSKRQRTEQAHLVDPPVEKRLHPVARAAVTALAELWGLFVDDGLLACALVAWCSLAVLGLPAIGAGRAFRAPLLLIGCLVILMVDVLATAFRGRAPRVSPASQ